MMSGNLLAQFYERDLHRLADEINQFQQEENLWRTVRGIKNSCGNLALHLIGGTRYLVGHQLAHTGYQRNRELEFTRKNVPRAELIGQLNEVALMVADVLKKQDLEADYPIPFDDAVRTNGYVLTQLALHLNYHLGQVNYLRRILEPDTGSI